MGTVIEGSIGREYAQGVRGGAVLAIATLIGDSGLVGPGLAAIVEDGP